MKIYDCFTFYNELDLLELRLELLYDHVDKFIIVESEHTFQNKPKPLYLSENQERFEKYSDKILLIVTPGGKHQDPWMNERDQRDAIKLGLDDADPDDIAIISDVDEFIRPEAIQAMRDSTAQVFGLRVPYFNFKFNYMLVNNGETYCVWNVAARVGALPSPEDLRRQRWTLHQLPYGHNDGRVMMLEHAGWHFTYLGDDDFIRTKIKSFAHSELNTDSTLAKINVSESIAQGRGFNLDDPRQFVTIDLDDYFPVQLQKYTQYVLPNTGNSARAFLPR